MPSPPAPPLYQRGVSFDTSETKDAPFELFTLSYKHCQYVATPNSRTFLCGIDAKDSADSALEWVIDELAEDGDEIICARVIENDSKIVGLPLSKRGRYRVEAKTLLESAISKNRSEKAIKIVVEAVAGKIPEIVQLMVELYDPGALIVVANGGNPTGMQGLKYGSVSKYCLQYSPVPVIVVRPNMVRPEKKRQHPVNPLRSLSSTYENTKATDKAVSRSRRGILKNKHEKPLVAGNSRKGDIDSSEMSPEPGFALPIGFLSTEKGPKADLAMMSPSIVALEEDWDDDDLGTKSTKIQHKTPKNGDDNSALSDTDDTSLRPKKIVEKRRPSVRESTPWLASILGPAPKKPPGQDRRLS